MITAQDVLAAIDEGQVPEWAACRLVWESDGRCECYDVDDVAVGSYCDSVLYSEGGRPVGAGVLAGELRRACQGSRVVFETATGATIPIDGPAGDMCGDGLFLEFCSG